MEFGHGWLFLLALLKAEPGLVKMKEHKTRYLPSQAPYKVHVLVMFAVIKLTVFSQNMKPHKQNSVWGGNIFSPLIELDNICNSKTPGFIPVHQDLNARCSNEK
jgi:hypothetical protein